MAGNARYTALLDACVLYPIAMTDSLMSLATAGLFAAKWTTRIEQEWIGALEERRPDCRRIDADAIGSGCRAARLGKRLDQPQIVPIKSTD
jgi:hypothetical protein